MGSHGMLHIAPFEGDPKIFPFFEQQLNDIMSNNKWSEAYAASFIRSKLAGNALKFVVASPDLLKAKDPKVLLDAIKKFFAPTSSVPMLFSSKLELLDGESIRNFAHRISVQVTKQFPTINDSEALKAIKLSKFCDGVPASLKVDLLKEGISDFDRVGSKFILKIFF